MARLITQTNTHKQSANFFHFFAGSKKNNNIQIHVIVVLVKLITNFMSMCMKIHRTQVEDWCEFYFNLNFKIICGIVPLCVQTYMPYNSV